MLRRRSAAATVNTTAWISGTSLLTTASTASRPDARIGEDRLGDHRAAQEVPELEPDRRDDRDRPVAEGVAQDHRRLADALRPGRPEEVLVQHLEHARARDARGPGHRPDAQGHGREDEGEPAVAAVHRHPAEVHGEREDQEDAEPERGHALSRQRERHGPRVEGGAAADGRHDPERQREDDREDDRGQRELGRGGEALQDERQRRLPVPERAPEVAVDRPRQEVAVLLRQRPVEPEGGAHDVVVRLRALGTQVERGGIAREMDDEEHGERDGDQDGGRPRETLNEIGDHARTTGRVGGSGRSRCGARSALGSSSTRFSGSSQL